MFLIDSFINKSHLKPFPSDLEEMKNAINLDGMTEQPIKALRLLVDSIKNDK